MNLKLLRELCEAPGAPGAEGPVREIVLQAAQPLVDESRIDELGNLILRRRGKGPRLLLDAHLDEVAFLVSAIEGSFVRIVPLGGIDPQVVYGGSLVIWGKRALPAVVGPRPPHAGEERKVPAIEDLFLDPGLSPERLAELVQVGDVVTFPPYFEETEEAVLAKALDDRVGLFILLEVLRELSSPVDLFVVASVQEEVGLKGAEALIKDLDPDVVLVVEGTLALDVPQVPPHQRLARCGEGPEIRLSDARFVADRDLSLGLAELARRCGLKHQVVVKKKGGTNAAAFQIAGGPRRVAAISVPVRYLHGPVSVAYKSDLSATIRLLKTFLEDPEDVLAYRWSYPSSA